MSRSFGQSFFLLTIFNEAAEHPKKRMNPEDAEGADQQSGHPHESPVENRVVLTIGMVTMRVVVAEIWGSLGMAFLAHILNIVGIDC